MTGRMGVFKIVFTIEAQTYFAAISLHCWRVKNAGLTALNPLQGARTVSTTGKMGGGTAAVLRVAALVGVQ